MLKAMSNDIPAATHPFRDKAAAILRRTPPKAYAALQFFRRTFLHVWRRRMLVGALVLPLLAATAVVSLHPQLAQWRPVLLLAVALAALTVAGGYLAFRVYLLAGRVHESTNDTDIRRWVTSELAAYGAKLTERLDQRAQSSLKPIGAVREEFSAVRQEFSASTWEVLALKEEVASFYGRYNALATDLAALSQRVDAFTSGRGPNALEREIGALSEAIAVLAKRCDALAGAEQLDDAVAALQTRISGVEAGCGAFAATKEAATVAREEAARLAREVAALAARCDTLASAEQLSSALAPLQASIGEIHERSEGFARTDALESMRNQITRGNAHFFQRFNRTLTGAHTEEFRTKWSKALSVAASDQVVGYIAHRACQIEQLLHGRIATSAEDITLRTLVALSVKKSTVNILEIGTLFGVGAAIMFDALVPTRQSVHLTLLDPLDGYYQGGQRDILTGLPVNEKLVRTNFAKVGMAEADFDLIKNMSTDAEAISAAAARRYDVLVIDGDHSYAGVKTDFENYARFVTLGGYVVFDDYGADDWPDVARFVDAEMPNQSRFARVGASWRTCVYRAVTPPPDDAATTS